MPGITLPNTGITLPELGGDAGEWDDLTNACWANYDVHDHSPGKGARVPSSGININADLSFGGKALTNLGKLAFAQIAALSSGATTLFVSSADGELYWRTAAGTNVRLTDGTSINTSLVGGILGDYSSVGAEVAYDDANEQYTFKDDSAPGRWARLASGPVRLYEFDTTETVYTEISVAAGLVAPYTITLPAAPPSNTSVVSMAPDGTLSAGPRTIPVSVSTSSWKRDDSIEAVSGDGFSQLGTGGWLGPDNTDPTTSILWIPMTAPVGAVITGYTLGFNKASNNTHSFNVVFMKTDATGGTALRTDTVNSNAPGATSLAVTTGTAIPTTIASLTSYSVRIQYTAGADPSVDVFSAFEFTYTTVV